MAVVPVQDVIVIPAEEDIGASVPEEHIRAAPAVQEIVPHVAEEPIASPTAVDRIVGAVPVERDGRLGEADRVDVADHGPFHGPVAEADARRRIAEDHVVTRTRDEDIYAPAAEHHVVPGASHLEVVPLPPVGQVSLQARGEIRLALRDRRIEIDRAVALAVEPVVPRAAPEDVLARPGKDEVVPVTAFPIVGPRPHLDLVMALRAIRQIVATPRLHEVIRRGAGEVVVFHWVAHDGVRRLGIRRRGRRRSLELHVEVAPREVVAEIDGAPVRQRQRPGGVVGEHDVPVDRVGPPRRVVRVLAEHA